jgi:hypothetical protein
VVRCVGAPSGRSGSVFAGGEDDAWEGRGGEAEGPGCAGGICGDKEQRALAEEHGPFGVGRIKITTYSRVKG